MPQKKPYYITTAISYPNGPPHIGHAYELIATDVLARFHRLDDRDVWFLTGTDEHGIKMEQTARQKNQTPRELCDKLTPRFREMAEVLNASNDDFIRTTESRHHNASQAIWDAMKNNGDIYLDSYAGWYSVRDEAYYAEEELFRNTGGDLLSPQGTPVEWVEEESYFFKLSKYGDQLLAFYEANPQFIKPDTRRNEVLSFVKSGLRDLSISRTTFDWGVPVPSDRKHVMYVWVDALTNYITALGYPDINSQAFRSYWPADVHIIGKDIVRFHAVYWPAFLISAGIPLPKQVFAHGFLNVKGEKMSKSLGNVVDPFELAKLFGVDQIRYFFMREVPFGQDGSYSHESMVARINSDLANDFGNLTQRVLSMIAKNCHSVVPKPADISEDDDALLDAATALINEQRKHLVNYSIHKALEAEWRIVSMANRYVDNQAPWALSKTDPVRMGTVLYILAETIRHLAILAQPVVPAAAEKILNLLAVPCQSRDFSALGEKGRLVPGTVLPKPEPVFPRFIETKN